jgi:hypothetical protein
MYCICTAYALINEFERTRALVRTCCEALRNVAVVGDLYNRETLITKWIQKRALTVRLPGKEEEPKGREKMDRKPTKI